MFPKSASDAGSRSYNQDIHIFNYCHLIICTFLKNHNFILYHTISGYEMTSVELSNISEIFQYSYLRFKVLLSLLELRFYLYIGLLSN